MYISVSSNISCDDYCRVSTSCHTQHPLMTCVPSTLPSYLFWFVLECSYDADGWLVACFRSCSPFSKYLHSTISTRVCSLDRIIHIVPVWLYWSGVEVDEYLKARLISHVFKKEMVLPTNLSQSITWIPDRERSERWYTLSNVVHLSLRYLQHSPSSKLGRHSRRPDQN